MVIQWGKSYLFIPEGSRTTEESHMVKNGAGSLFYGSHRSCLQRHQSLTVRIKSLDIRVDVCSPGVAVTSNTDTNQQHEQKRRQLRLHALKEVCSNEHYNIK